MSAGATPGPPARRPGPDPALHVLTTSPRLAHDGLADLVARLGAMVAEGFPPAVSIAVVGADSTLFEAYGGLACLVGDEVPVAEDTRYDLASLTKVVCTVTLCLMAAREGRLRLDEPVAARLPRFPERETTLAHLLTHTSGLVDHRPFFLSAWGREAIEQAVYAEAAHGKPAAQVCYSDLNFMLLGWVLESTYGATLDSLFAERVAAPLGLAGTGFRPAPSLRRRTAATELDGDQRRSPELVWGEVHDGNAFALGGVSGHAGLFGTLGDMTRFVQALLDPAGSRLLDPAGVALLATRRAATGADVRGLGWRLEPGGWGSWPAGTIWHTGFTGTSLLVAAPAGIGVVLLTNAVHPHRRLEQQAAMRAELHRLVAGALR